MFLRMRSRRLTTSSHSGLMKMSFHRQKISSRRIRKILRSDSFRTHSFFGTRFRIWIQDNSKTADSHEPAAFYN